MERALQNTAKVTNPTAISNNKAVVGETFIPVANVKARVTTADREKAVALIEQSFAIQQERIQIIVDAALLAVEQVQDKRLELLEKGKTVTINDVIFDLLSVYLWEVGLVGHVLQPLVKEVTRVICSKSLKYSAVYNQLSKSDYGAQFIGYARQEKNSKELLKNIIGEHVRNSKQYSSEEFAIFSKEARELVASAPEVVWKKATGTVAKWKEMKKKVKETTLEKTDTPGVSMLKAAQSYVSRHRFALEIQKARIIAWVRSQSTMTVTELRELLPLFEAEELPDTAFIRDQYQWTFEIIIWARMYGFKTEYAGSPKVFSNSDEGFQGIRTDLTYYWFDRFREVWISYARLKGDDWDQLSVPAKATAVKNYYIEVMKKLEEKAGDTGSIEDAFIVTDSKEN